MNSKLNKDEIFRRYLDGELTADEEREALHMIADDPDLRSMLQFERNLRAVSPDVEVEAGAGVPDGFSDRVMQAIEKSDRKKAAEPFDVIKKVRRWLESVWIPRTVTWRPAYGLAVALLLLITVSLPFYLIPDAGLQEPAADTEAGITESVQTVSQAQEQVWLRFVYIDRNAESISVAGDFSDWEPIPLNKQVVNGEQVWTGLVSMSRGEHRYMFVKDGEEWVTDPLASVQREDGFGNKNAVIYL